ncbi:MAG: teichuronic acid biosynthesis glycosyltransferase TuaH [Actinomycetota bacterium]|nr:teichuronic acid biosynthesis glycosyltransferase TuaH [Actinomycetota bacterium]
MQASPSDDKRTPSAPAVSTPVQVPVDVTTATSRDVIVIGSNSFEAAVPLGDWHLARAFARQNHRVLYVNPVRSVFTYGARRFGARTRLSVAADSRIAALTPIGVYGRLRGVPAGIQGRWVTYQVRAAAARLGMRDPLVLTVRPERGIWSGLSRGPLVYWQKDAEWTAVNVAHPEWTHRSYLRLLHAADVVVTVSARLRDLARENGVAAVIVPNGCDLSAADRETPEPPALAGLTRPRAVYAGSVSGRVDTELFDRLVREFPAVAFIIIGSGDTRMPEAPNVHVVGQLSFDELRSYLRYADVGLVPYTPSDFNAASRPLKIYDYLAAGLPVLATGINVDGLDELVVRAAADHDEAVVTFARLIEQSADLQQAALAEARRNTWDARLETLLALAYS